MEATKDIDTLTDLETTISAEGFGSGGCSATVVTSLSAATSNSDGSTATPPLEGDCCSPKESEGEVRLNSFDDTTSETSSTSTAPPPSLKKGSFRLADFLGNSLSDVTSMYRQRKTEHVKATRSAPSGREGTAALSVTKAAPSKTLAADTFDSTRVHIQGEEVWSLWRDQDADVKFAVTDDVNFFSTVVHLNGEPIWDVWQAQEQDDVRPLYIDASPLKLAQRRLRYFPGECRRVGGRN